MVSRFTGGYSCRTFATFCRTFLFDSFFGERKTSVPLSARLMLIIIVVMVLCTNPCDKYAKANGSLRLTKKCLISVWFSRIGVQILKRVKCTGIVKKNDTYGKLRVLTSINTRSWVRASFSSSRNLKGAQLVNYFGQHDSNSTCRRPHDRTQGPQDDPYTGAGVSTCG